MTRSTFSRRPARRRSRLRVRWAALLPVFALGLMIPLWLTGSALSATAVDLGDAASFGALSATAMTNAGEDTVVGGDVGSSTSIGAGVTNPGYAQYGAGTPELAAAQASLLTAYGFAEAQAPDADITGTNLAGETLVAGVYNSTSGILIDGPIALTLDGGGDPDAVFIFQAASAGDLTVGSTSSVTYVNGAQPCNVFWKVNSAFLQNTDNTFVGTILALTQITLTDNITVEGRLLALNADVTFIHDTVVVPSCAAVVTTTETTETTTTTAETTTTETTTTTPTTETTTTETTVPAPAPAPAPTPPTTTPTPAPVAAPTGDTAAARRAAARREAARVAAARATKIARGHARPARSHTGFTG